MIKQLFFTLALLSLSISLSAQCIRGNCHNGKGVRIYKEGRYAGQFKNGVRHGKGTFRLKKGDIYIGQFVRGQFEGKGRFKFANGDMYLGDWKGGTMHGEGTYTFSSGQQVRGRFENGKKVDTSITSSYASSSTPPKQSNSKDNDCNTIHCHNVSGTYRYADGSKYIGEFVNGQPNGYGKCEYINGDVYEGEWKDHAPHGKGIMHFASGQKYAARWEYGTPKEQMLDDIDYATSPKKRKNTYNDRVDIYALVVGVARYTHMPSLKYTDDDAYQVYAFLKSPEGGAIPEGKIRVLIDDDATRSNILAAMEDLFYRADANDMVFLYLSGHGLDGSFIPSDFNGFSNNITYKEITKIIDASEAKSKVCIADACHSGSLVAAKSPYQASLDQYFDVLKRSKGGTALMMSSAAEEVSLEYSGLRQGVFSHYLLRGMLGEADTDANKIVTITELFKFVSNGVGTYTAHAQTPILTGTYDRNMPVAMVR